MVNYQQGKIYCIRSHQTDDIYIGSTICFKGRKRQHKKACNSETYNSYNYKI